MMSNLVILDRDGVINFDSDHYIKSLNEWQPIPNSIHAIARLSKAGFIIVLATNQSGLARKYFSLETLNSIHLFLTNLVNAKGGKISGIFYCPHLPTDLCNCRKPNSGLLDQIESQLSLSVKDAWFIGDTEKDMQVALSKQCNPILVKTGKGEKTIPKLTKNMLNNIIIKDDLNSAVSLILGS